MPIPKEDESQKDFISRCIPFVINEGTTDDSKQASAICYSIWRKHKRQKNEEDDMKKERIHLNLCANIFTPSTFELAKEAESDSATLIVGDGVYNGIYFPSEELEKAFRSWERQPINLDHSDKVEDEIGYLKNVDYDYITKKITAKPIINDYMPKANIARGYIKSRFDAEKVPEGSVGVWLDRVPEEMEDGKIRLTARNLEGDHYAIVTRGACSPNDGCGIGMSKNQTITISFNYSEDEEINKIKKEILKQKINLEKNGGK